MAQRSRALLALPPVLVLVALLVTLRAAPARGQTDEPASTCVPGLAKSADPSSLLLGSGDSLVTLVMTHTCGPARLPVDLIFLVDESDSMTIGRPGGDLGTPRATDDPRATQEPPTPVPPDDPPPPPGPGDPGGPGGPGGRNQYDPCLYTPPRGGGGGGAEPPSPPQPPGPGPGPGQTPIRTEEPTPTREGDRPTPTSALRPPEVNEEPPGGEDLIREAQSAIRDFLDRPEVRAEFAAGNLRAGVVAFNHQSRILQRLTDRESSVRSAINRIRPSGGTRINIGMNAAVQELRRASSAGGGRLDHNRGRLIVVYSDGQFCARDIRNLGTSRDQILVAAVGMGRSFDRPLLSQVATEREYVLTRFELRELVRLFTTVMPLGRDVTMNTLKITEILGEHMRYVPDSAIPAPSSVTTRTLEWELAPTDPLTVSYRIEPLAEGMLPVSDESRASWVDSQTRAGSGDFPPVYLDVYLPTPTITPTPTQTPTSTATNTPTATPTKEPQPAYLPYAVNKWPPPVPTPGCEPSVQTVDVALVIDTSTSMRAPTHDGGARKIDAAVDAGIRLVEFLKFPGSGPQDQATVVSFNRTAQVVTPLSSDPSVIADGLRQLSSLMESGTAIDRGLEAGWRELDSERHVAANNRVIILVSDGVQSEGTNADVLAMAAQVKATGITVWTVALGAEVDMELLRSVASAPEKFRYAPNAEGLRLIYEEIARFIPCE